MNAPREVPEELVQALSAEYDVLHELGRGSASVVYLARDRVLGRLIAVKVIRDAHLDDPEALARFEREAQTLARMQHPNIVTLYGARRLPSGSLALLMEHGDWHTLKGLVRENGPLPAATVQRVLSDIASALEYLHERKVIHRDVKPENIFVDRETGRALLSDFGIAKVGDGQTSLTMTGVVIGTPAYMAPEQIDGKELTGRSDLYSLGMVGWEMLSGRRPWEGENLYGVIFKQKAEPLPSLAGLRPEVPESLLHAVERATRKDPAARWQRARELAAYLAGAAAEVPEAAPPLPVPFRGSSLEEPTPTLQIERPEPALAAPRRPRRASILAAALGGLILAGGVGTAAVATRQQEPEAERAAPTRTEAPPATISPAAGPLASPAPAEKQELALSEPPAAPVDETRAEPAATRPDERQREEPAADRAVERRDEQRPAAPAPLAPAPLDRVDSVRRAAPSIPFLAPDVDVAAISPAAPSAQPEAGPTYVARHPAAPKLLNQQDVVNRIARAYGAASRSAGGTVVLALLVSPDGRVTDARVSKRSGDSQLDDAALQVVRYMRFEPGALRAPLTVSLPLTLAAGPQP